MPVLDLFKKPSKKGPVRKDPFGSPEMQKKRYDAAVEFLGVLQENLLSSNGRGHAGTNLSVAAWLAGTSLYRAMNYRQDSPPGTIMLSEEVNEAWPALLKLFLYYCQRSGIELDPNQWITKISDEHQPQMDISLAQEMFQDRYNEIMKKHGLDYLDGARAGMIVCSIVFQHHCTRARDMDLNVGGGIISMGIVAGAKTVPPPPGQGCKFKSRKDDRLVLGEDTVAIQHALDHGGIFIDPGPEVVRLFQQSNVDPYLIYEKAMLAQIEKKIPRIDFVQADVDELFKEWIWKPNDQIPIYVKLIFWLKNNASAYNYFQQGNSWILK
jgi:hypothetical protein